MAEINARGQKKTRNRNEFFFKAWGGRRKKRSALFMSKKRKLARPLRADIARGGEKRGEGGERGGGSRYLLRRGEGRQSTNLKSEKPTEGKENIDLSQSFPIAKKKGRAGRHSMARRERLQGGKGEKERGPRISEHRDGGGERRMSRPFASGPERRGKKRGFRFHH